MPDEQRYLSHAERTVRAVEKQSDAIQAIADFLEPLNGQDELEALIVHARVFLQRENKKRDAIMKSIAFERIFSCAKGELETMKREIERRLESLKS